MDQLILAFSEFSMRPRPVPPLPAVTINCLPAEILAKIFEHLSNDDILNLPHRISAKGLFDIEGRRRFSQHRTWIEKQSLQNLTRVSRHPVSRRYVQELIFCHEMPCELTLEHFIAYWAMKHSSSIGRPLKSFYPYLEAPLKEYEEVTLENFHTLVGTPEGSCSVCSCWSSLSARWDAHQSTIKDLQKLQEDGEDIRMLAEAFNRFESPSAISIDNFHRSAEDRRDLGLRYFFDTETDSNCASTCEGSGNLYQYDSTFLRTVVKALLISNSKLSSFKIWGNANRSWYNDRESTGLSLSLNWITAVDDAFSNVRKMELRGIWCMQGYPMDRKPRRGGVLPLLCWEEDINNIIRSAVWLEELTIHFTSLRQTGTTYGLPDTVLDRLPGPNRLRHLKKLDLAHFRVQAARLVAFLQVSAKTLKHLILRDVVLHGSWESVFDELKGVYRLEILRLRSLQIITPNTIPSWVELCGCETPYQAGGDEEALAWLCGRSEVNPFRPTQSN